MHIGIKAGQLKDLGLDDQQAAHLIEQIDTVLSSCDSAEQAWFALTENVLSSQPFIIHSFLYSLIYPDWHDHPEAAPAWLPDKHIRDNANITKFMNQHGFHEVKTFHRWTVTHYEDFWSGTVDCLNIIFKKKPERICDLSQGLESPHWLPGAELNITDSCFTASPEHTAIIYQDGEKQLHKMTYGELNKLSSRIANSLIKQGFTIGDAIGIAMPMNQFAVAIYLGIIKMGGVVVSIADSFSSQEIATRLRIANAKAVFTQDFTLWGHKKLPLYAKVSEANPQRIIVVPVAQHVTETLRVNDISWDDFLVDNSAFTSVSCNSMTACNILFSSGTTADPKAIVWNHSTPIKAASDGWFHHNIQPGDVFAWPTNLGWMMGPWLIYASLINHATIALYTEAPKDREFGEFIERAKVNIMGVVPTAVAAWRQSHCMDKLDWSAIKTFTSTGECSNPHDMLYLMSLANYKPVIEYCGGTEIGGAYISSTVIEKNCPSLFTTAAMGMNIVIIDEKGKPSTEGQVAIIPPSIGLSTKLLNANHHKVYYTDMPKSPEGETLRRHGDQIRKFPYGYYCILGRVDDTMNLGGIKISSAEIERILVNLPEIIEVAAIAIPPPDHGPSLLVIYAETKSELDKQGTMKDMQKKINSQLNPLFKIHDVILTKDLPKTASNKIMRRVLREQYLKSMPHNH